MRGRVKLFWRVVLTLGLLGLSGILVADVIEHSVSILEDTLWCGTDEHTVTGDVTVYPQVTPPIEAPATVRVAAGSDHTAGAKDPQCSELVVNGSLLTNGPGTLLGQFTLDTATPVSGDRRGFHSMLTLPRASQFSTNLDCGIAHRPLPVSC